MKWLFALLTALALAGSLTACGKPASQSAADDTQGPAAESPAGGASADSPVSDEEAGASAGDPRILVAYFSATGNTEEIAMTLQEILDAALWEITPEVPYTDEDLDYRTDGCRANQEQNDPAARPAISGTLENPAHYDVVFLGYPIWWGQAPKIMYTFLESYDFGDAALVPFCTSGSSGIGGSLEALQALAPAAVWLEGQQFDAGASREEIQQWTDGLSLPGKAA